jgi:two-component system, OmpR family, KDP operon response regulator KdpE
MPLGEVLVVDDEPKLLNLVREVLSSTGYSVRTAESGVEVLDAVAEHLPDLVLLDVVLRGPMDGYQVARRLREFSQVPIILVTARGREQDVLTGFAAGADDYLCKPFSSRELLVRVRAVLRRSAQHGNGKAESVLECGGIRIDQARRSVSAEGREVRLTPTEYHLLLELARQAGEVVLHEQLLTAVWGPEYEGDLDYLRAYVRYLRLKLEDDPSAPRWILTSPGQGYRLAVPEPAVPG